MFKNISKKGLKIFKKCLKIFQKNVLLAVPDPKLLGFDYFPRFLLIIVIPDS